jgi:excisionase family DNA binding protein
LQLRGPAREKGEDMGREFLNAVQVAEKLGVSRSWVLRKAQAKIIPHIKIGGVTRFPEKEVNDWIMSHRVGGCQKI